MSARAIAAGEAGSRSTRKYLSTSSAHRSSSSEQFGAYVFNRTVMEKMLPRTIVHQIVAAIEGRAKLDPVYADPIANAMKEWALSHGATHYCHWFQPLTGSSAEKHDSFIDWCSSDGVIERFGGKQLIQGEPDASSFPSGGLRSTYEARGYTGWDPSSPAFLWKAGDGLTLFVPSVFFSWTGEVLDTKIPVLRSEQRLNQAVLRLLRLTGTSAGQVFSTLGWEQEYFVIDRALRNLRPDLLMLGRTVYGAPPAKGQQMQDHYFASVKDRVLAFMQHFEDEALKLGIPVKTRHNEVAPAQHEVAPVFERASIAIDHNIMLMELMRKKAAEHDLACLLDEKPFAGVNGSGKHANWSIATDTGMNLLEPGESPEQSLQFITLLTAVLAGVHRHEALLRGVVASASNDLRLGGHEAPPAIMSVYLGEQLEDLLQDLEREGTPGSRARRHTPFDLGISVIPDLPKDNTDRNRTSPIAFTGNKFEFRAPGSAQNCAEAVTVLNVAVAESLEEILDAVEAVLPASTTQFTQAELAKATLPILVDSLKRSRPIRFSGDNYSAEWKDEAQRRGLSNHSSAPQAFATYLDPKTVKVFRGTLTAEELASRFEVVHQNYAHMVEIEADLMIDLFRTQILPVAQEQQRRMALSIQQVRSSLGTEALLVNQQAILEQFVRMVEDAIAAVRAIEEERAHGVELSGPAWSQHLADVVRVRNRRARELVDALEGWVDDKSWPLPKYCELLYIN